MGRRRTRHFALLAALVGPFVAVAVGAIYQFLGQSRDLERFPPPGELVDVGGFRLHLNCEGTGRPTVVIEAGMGNDSLNWRALQSSLSSQLHICTYDRAGSGWSDADDQAPTRERIARNLRTLLRNAGIEPPFVLVGHSAGGIYARRFALEYPSDVAAMVLVDSSHENQRSRLPQEFAAAPDPFRAFLQRCRLVAPFGVIRAFGVMGRRLPKAMPAEIRAVRIAQMNRTHFCGSLLESWVTFQLEDDRSDPLAALGDMPLIVLTAGSGLAERADELQIDLPVEALEARDRIWVELQRELAALSTNGEHRIVPNAGHFIHLDQPRAVVDAILDVQR